MKPHNSFDIYVLKPISLSYCSWLISIFLLRKQIRLSCSEFNEQLCN